MADESGIEQLLAIMARLRAPVGGCPWDLEQTFATIAPHTIEEAHEVAAAIEEGDPRSIKDELGDLLFQVVFQGRIGEEQGLFDFDAIARHCAEKMIRRHPHIFGDAGGIETAADQSEAWERIKERERGTQAGSALDGVPLGLPALLRAVKLQRRAARVGFDWTEATPILDKIEEEIGELRAELQSGLSREAASEELGDVLFTVANLARRLELDPEAVLRAANAKFERRFRWMEQAVEGQSLAQHSPEQLEALWARAKHACRK